MPLACPAWRRSVSRSAFLAALPINSFAINVSNNSRASSVAVTSNRRTVASNVAILRG